MSIDGIRTAADAGSRPARQRDTVLHDPNSASPHHAWAVEDRRNYALLYAICFPLFLSAAIVARLLPSGLRPIPLEHGHYWAVVCDARKAAGSVLPYAFMG